MQQALCLMTSNTVGTWCGVSTCCPKISVEAQITSNVVTATALKQLGHSIVTESNCLDEQVTVMGQFGGSVP